MALFGRKGKNPQEMDETERRRRALDAERSALLFLKGGLLRPAETDLRKCVELAPEYAAGHNYLGMVLYRLGELEAANRELEIAVELAPDDEALRRTQGTILEGLGRLEEAEAAYAAAVQVDPNSGWAHAALGDVLLRRGDLRAAEEHLLTATKLNPSDMLALADLAEVRRARGSVIRAIDALQRALAVLNDTETPLVLRTGGMVAVQDSGARGPAAAPYHFQLGQLLESNGDLDGAITELRAAVEFLSGEPQVVQVLARVLIKRGRDAEAQQAYDRAIKAHPDKRAAYDADLRALLAAHTLSSAAGAEGGSRPAVQGHAQRSDAQPAVTGRGAGVLPEAVLQLQQAIEADPNNSKLHRDLSIEFTRIGRLAEAKEHYRRAEDLRAAHMRGQRSVG